MACHRRCGRSGEPAAYSVRRQQSVSRTDRRLRPAPVCHQAAVWGKVSDGWRADQQPGRYWPGRIGQSWRERGEEGKGSEASLHQAFLSDVEITALTASASAGEGGEQTSTSASLSLIERS